MGEAEQRECPSSPKESNTLAEQSFPPTASQNGITSPQCSLIRQDNHLQLLAAVEKTTEALGNSYSALQQLSATINDKQSETGFPQNEKEISRTASGNAKTMAPTATNRRFTVDNGPPIPKRRFSFDTTLRQRGQIHLQSADLFENFSPVQRERRLWLPTLPDAYAMGPIQFKPVEAPELPQHDAEQLRIGNPQTFGRPCLEIYPQNTQRTDVSPLMEAHEAGRPTESPQSACRPLRVGIVLSGGPAPGGHNVIAGLYDYIKQAHPESQLFGFMGGLDGLFQERYRVVNSDLMNRFRNQGGFDMLWSGRGRLNGKDDFIRAKTVCSQLGLQGLVIVGGDGSQSNAALLSEHFATNLPSCSVVGVPKTIDGDLQNPWIETSFGFDTAAKTYSELIGNLCTDVITGQQVYHFVRVMGRTASHLVVECALQTRPNLVFVGEEVETKNVTLKQIVDEIVDLIIERRNKGKVYGIILVPEGLIEFVPEIKTLIQELNMMMTKGDLAGKRHEMVAVVRDRLSEASLGVWNFLPEAVQDQLLMDRESTGYVQVAKIATERLLKVLAENELQRRNEWTDDLICMPHYFGYEGRCAMPSNFDANYCYTLGYTAGALVDNGKNGYVSVARHLDQNPVMWRPCAIPFTRIMQIKRSADGKPFPAVRQQLVNLSGPLFKVLCEARDQWKFEDHYRCPGPIQFEGAVADIVNYTVALPTIDDLLGGKSCSRKPNGTLQPTRLGALSDLQKYRLQDRPEIPSICKDFHARAVPGSQYLPKDPFTQRQILHHYPYMCNDNQFYLQEVIHDSNTAPVDPGLRVGVVFLSRQSPGVMNVLWGIHERLKLVRGKCLGFYGTKGLFEGRYLEITDEALELHLNQGGMELLGRATVHSLFSKENQEKARVVCEKLYLSGLIVVGSSLAMTEATLTAEYFLSQNCRTAVIGIPATGSNNLTHDLIESNIGFDTSSKLYASLIGNVLTEAASMPKYWHFVRLMGRQPSNEVLECALQTHPNVVIIAEEYGAANKTLWDVVTDIADVVCKRAEMGKNFGSVLIPDGLLSHLPNMKLLMNELATVVRQADRAGQLRELQAALHAIAERPLDEPPQTEEQARWAKRITPWSLALFKSLPRFIRKELTQVDMGEMRFTLIETELLLSQMVQEELETRKRAGKYSGKFAYITHFFGYQGRSSMPSRFDAKLAFAYGHLAAICVESGLTAHCCTIRGLCGNPARDWKLGAIPFNSMLMFTAQQDDIHPDLRNKKTDLPIIPSAEVNLNGKAYRWMRTAVEQWQLQDRFCNPGPVQFYGKASEFYHRMLHEEQAEYFNMLRNVQLYSCILKDTCNFGVDENFLKVVFANLHALLALRFHRDDLMSFLPALSDVQRYEEWQSSKGQRPEVWRMDNEGAPIDYFSSHPVQGAERAIPSHKGSGTIPYASRPSIIGLMASIRLKSRGSFRHGTTNAPIASQDHFTTDAAADNCTRLTSDSSVRYPYTHDNPLPGHGSFHAPTISDAGWGDQPGVEAYPRSTMTPSSSQQDIQEDPTSSAHGSKTTQ